MINLPPALIFFIGAVLLPLLPRRIRPAAFLVFPVIAFWWLLRLSSGDSQTFDFLSYRLVVTRVDELSLVFGYVFLAVAFLGGIFSYHLKDTMERVSTLLYCGSALGVVFAGDLLTLLVFWEIMALASVYLIWGRRTPQSRGAGMRYLMVHLFGGSVLIAGVLLHYSQTGSLLFNHMESGLASYLILFAVCLNAAVPPLSAWLSDAYPEGTITGSVFLSAFTTKAAVYVLARGFAGWDVLIWAGVIMVIYGVIYAVMENDIRRLLAYHIISQVGYMVAGVGIGTAVAINAVSAHAFTNIFNKGLLFMGAGVVIYATGRSKLSELGGLAKVIPWVFILYMVGAFSISGFPLFSGFISKSMVIYAAGLSGLGITVLLLNLATVGTFLSTALKLPYFTWFGKPASPPSPIKLTAIPPGMYIGMALTAMLCILIGLYPNLLYNILPNPVEYRPYTSGHILEVMQLLVFTAIGFWLLLKWLQPKNSISLDTDWFYRRPAKLAYSIFVVAVNRFFALFETLSLRLARYLSTVSVNPLVYLSSRIKSASKFDQSKKDSPLPDYDPDRQRFTVELMVIISMLLLVILMAWGLIRLM
jgi:multicomponent Na+:H+ antiporter subunit D